MWLFSALVATKPYRNSVALCAWQKVNGVLEIMCGEKARACLPPALVVGAGPPTGTELAMLSGDETLRVRVECLCLHFLNALAGLLRVAESRILSEGDFGHLSEHSRESRCNRFPRRGVS